MRNRNKQRGAASLEFALVVPIFLLIFAATATIGHALTVRYRLSDAAMVASRNAVITGRFDQPTALSIVRDRLGTSVQVCAPQVFPTTVALPGGGRAFQIRAECPFTGGVAAGLLRSVGIAQPQLQAIAATPY